MLLAPEISVLGEDPPTVHRLNACAYQQSAITSFGGLQYVAFYSRDGPSNARFVTLARRNIQEAPVNWRQVTFTDYEQTTDDGHNTISIGICRGDGTIHIAFDHHCDVLKYRVSRPGLATDLNETAWSTESFGPICNSLPGSLTNEPLVDVTYPRFLSTDDKMFFECRIGKAGAGSEILYLYDAAGQFKLIGNYLIGRQCNPYPNGISWHRPTRTLHVTWTNRHFIEYEGAANPDSTVHKAQTGPNGPENNEGLYYAYSSDYGRTWKSHSTKEEVATVSSKPDTGLDSRDRRLLAQEIPKNSGIMNQEGQMVCREGDIHVLNRENTSGEERWIHYHLDVTHGWKFSALPFLKPTESGPRGKVVQHTQSDSILFVLPSNTDSNLVIIRAARGKTQKWYDEYDVVWREEGYTGEPLVDEEALSEHGILSIFTTRSQGGKREIVVLNFDLSKLVPA
ncbi:CAZyme family GH145 [Paecilomyces variotii]|nr:CAZyme family GH145 [Paecilomyces variotii]KAJ9401642.1 CAZyme family GH145 [Paecilomyces variotii]